MTQQVLTPELARDLAKKIVGLQITKLDIESQRSKSSKNKGKIIAKWEEGETGSVPGESFAYDTLYDVADDLEDPATRIVNLSVRKPEPESEIVVIYSAVKGITKSNAHQ